MNYLMKLLHSKSYQNHTSFYHVKLFKPLPNGSSSIKLQCTERLLGKLKTGTFKLSTPGQGQAELNRFKPLSVTSCIITKYPVLLEFTLLFCLLPKHRWQAKKKRGWLILLYFILLGFWRTFGRGHPKVLTFGSNTARSESIQTQVSGNG